MSNINRGYCSEFELKSYYEDRRFPHMVTTKSQNSYYRHPDTGEKLYEQCRFYADGELKYIEFQNEKGVLYNYADEHEMPIIKNSDGKYTVGKTIEAQMAEDQKTLEAREKQQQSNANNNESYDEYGVKRQKNETQQEHSGYNGGIKRW